MRTLREAALLRVHISERDRHHGHPLYEAVVLKAREHGLAGATVLRGLVGYGRSSHIHTGRILDLSLDLPLVIEIVDDEERIAEFLPLLDQMVGHGLVTLEKVRVLRDRPADAQVPHSQ